MVRAKFRYFVVEVKEIKEKFKPLQAFCSSELFKKALCDKIKELHGDYGIAATTHRLRVRYFGPNTNVVCIRVCHGPHRFVASSIPFMNAINKRMVAIRTIHVSATLRKAYSFINNHYKEELEEALCLPTTSIRNVFIESAGNERGK